MSTTIHDVLDRMRATAASNRELGDRFEQLMKSYLTTDPQFVQQFSDVWLWSEWPDNDGKTDTGIDLVAKNRDAEGYSAIQCKFYEPTHHLAKEDIDSFFTASGKSPFTSRIIISTTDRWGRNAEDALNRQQIPVSRIGLSEISQSPITWDIAWPVAGATFTLALEPKKSLRPHQADAVKAVVDGFSSFDRGKLIMACGTGKTFTSLKIAEQVAAAKGADGHTSVLFLVPSISLLSQSLRDWTAQSTTGMRTFAVCSDTKVGRHSTVEDISAHDLAFPATTDTGKLVQQMADAGKHAPLTVIFSTYQSIGTVAQAQQAGLPEFDLIICDEAHRTTGVTLAGEDDSNFVRVHDQSYIQGRKRLYMTATPRLFDDSTKTAAQEKSAVLASMDDERLFGPEFHRLGFGQAVEEGLLTDYKVLILTVDEKYIARSLQSQLADDNAEIRIDDAVKIVGCWNGLAKRSGTTADGSGFAPGEVPMRRAVAFSRSIAESKKLTDRFTQVIDGYEDADEGLLRCEVQHVDGTYNALLRNQKLDWLKAEIGENECRILSNARCLTEGVDVPDLDAVLFLNPRNSVVDVVQSVGRVMRRSEGKDYGYIILPVGIPADTPPEQALADNKRYKIVWQVLQALRAHDDRFNATINKIDLNKNKPKQIMVGTVGFDDGAGNSSEQSSAASTQLALDLHVQEWRDAIYAKIVKKVGERAYWENWAKDVAAIAEKHTARITALLDGPTNEATEAFESFLLGLRNNLNDSISRDDAVDMLSQHLITRPVFEALFENYSFTQHNPVSQVMQRMLDVLDKHHVDNETDSLEAFYASVRTSVADIDNIKGKQRIITELYERFFKIAFPRAAESLGIVYTPVEVVDFIIRAVESTLRSEFDASISDPGVHVLDPFTGTGTFIVRLLQSGLIRSDDLLHKYTRELHANEILLLAYYIAAINIEATYHAIAGGEYQPFNGIVLTDTFQISEDGDSMDEVMFPQNNERVAHQKALDIRVILGNPPYSAGQNSQNDANQNQKYPTLDSAIARTYAARSTATNKNSLYDSYIRAIRWATDRIGDDGIICYVSNGGYIDGNTADGLRKTLAEEFSSIYCYNLRGNQRTAGELSRREGGKIFGQGSRSTVAILLLVKNPAAEPGCKIYYHDIGDYLTREQKLAIVASGSLDMINWQRVAPNLSGDWVNHRTEVFETFPAIGDKKSASRQPPIFNNHAYGLLTSRDAWLYNYSQTQLARNVARMLTTYNDQVVAYQVSRTEDRLRGQPIEEFVNRDPTKISWSSSLLPKAAKGQQIGLGAEKIREAMYRPFSKQALYFDSDLVHRPGQFPRMFPTSTHENVGIYVTGVGSDKPFSVLATSMITDLALWGSSTGQFFSRYEYEGRLMEPHLSSDSDDSASLDRIDNITDAILADYRKSFGSAVTKDDIFYYVYGVLHSPEYREVFAADLKKSLPRIPKVADSGTFQAFAQAGRQLAALHIGYENVEPYAVTEQTQGDTGDPGFYRVHKMAFGKAAGSAKDRSRIVYNRHITVTGLPEEAYRYQLGSRSAIEWIMDRYQVRTDKASGIVNDPNDWAAEHGQPRYILDLLKRIVTVSVKTMKIVDGLPSLNLLADSR